MGFLTNQIPKAKTPIPKNKEDMTETDVAVKKCEDEFKFVIGALLKSPNISFEHIEQAFDKSLKQLENKYIDNIEINDNK